MGLMDILFAPYERFGEKGGFLILVVVGIVGAIVAVWMFSIGVYPAAAAMFVVDFVFSYGILFLFLYLMWYRRPK